VDTGGYVVSENCNVAVHVSFWGHSSAYFRFYSEKVIVEAWNFLCFKHVCAEFHLASTFLETKTFGAVIKFCIIRLKYFFEHKSVFGDCLVCIIAWNVMIKALKFKMLMTAEKANTHPFPLRGLQRVSNSL